MKISNSTIFVNLNEKNLSITIQTPTTTWTSVSDVPYFIYQSKHISFLDATSITHEYKNNQIVSTFTNYFDTSISFQTCISIDDTTNEIQFQWIPQETKGITDVYWPMPFSFDEGKDSWYTLLPLQQGLLLPNTWKKELTQTPFHGFFCSSSAYMPWISQIKNRQGYLLINDTPWDSMYQIHHPSYGPYTHVSIHWIPSLQDMSYSRCLRMLVLDDCDYVTIAKAYRKDAFHKGKVHTLTEKCKKNPSIEHLIGSLFLHKGIKTHVQQESRFFDHKHPDRFESLTTFQKRQQEIHEWSQLGAQKLYLHLDGWTKDGYDNGHPSILPPCAEAGGWIGLKALIDEIHSHHYMIGLHDQYRDYYHLSKDYTPNNSIQASNGTIPSHANWAGGKQDYLCASLALSYIKRNYQEIFKHDLHLDATYLDVFTCNEPDECANPNHIMTRKDCLMYRNQCFEWMLNHQILTSSEEVNEWSLPYQIFAHYAPYEFMMKSVNEERSGIFVPLFNLVYHDCVILPWPMEQCKGKEDYMLYALLNGGAPYLDKDGAYPNTDGVFDSEYERLSKEEKLKRANVVAEFQTLVAKEEMVSHSFINHDYHIQETTFSNGCKIRINLHTNTYELFIPEETKR